jgi:hypothetical protein
MALTSDYASLSDAQLRSRTLAVSAQPASSARTEELRVIAAEVARRRDTAVSRAQRAAGGIADSVIPDVAGELHEQEDRLRTFAVLFVVALFALALIGFSAAYISHKVL